MSGVNEVTEFKDVVATLDELRALMGEPSEIALRKDIGRIDSIAGPSSRGRPSSSWPPRTVPAAAT